MFGKQWVGGWWRWRGPVVRGHYRVIFENPEEPVELELTKREIQTEWEPLESSKAVNRAHRIGQLNAIRFKMQPRNKNLSIGGSINVGK